MVAQAHEPGGGARPKPLLIAVDDEPDPLSLLERELRERYGEDYEVMCFPEPAPAVQTLEYFREAGLPVAVVLADHWTPDMTGAQLLVRAHELHAHAKRVLRSWTGTRGSPRRSQPSRCSC